MGGRANADTILLSSVTFFQSACTCMLVFSLSIASCYINKRFDWGTFISFDYQFYENV